MLVSLTKSFGALRIKSIVLNVPVRAALLATKSSAASAKSPKKLSRAKSKRAPSASSKKASEELKAVKPEKITVPPPPASRCCPFTLFLSENFAKFHKNGMLIGEVAKIVAQKYRELSAAELEALKLRSAAVTKNCAKNYATWAKSLSSAQIAMYNAYLKKKGKKGRVVDPARPKRPLSAFILFLNDNLKLPEYESLSIPERVSLLGKKWAELNPTLKKKYEDDQAKRSAEYAKLFKAYSKKLSV